MLRKQKKSSLKFKHPTEYSDDELHEIIVNEGITMSFEELKLFAEESIRRNEIFIQKMTLKVRGPKPKSEEASSS